MDVQEELDGVLHWIAVLLILLLQWLYPKVPWSPDLSRMFYGHLTLSRDFGLLSPYPAFYSIVCMGNLFPTRGSHNIIGCAICLLLSQCFLQSLIYCPVFPGTIHCTYYWRPAESSLSSIFFCWLLWHFYYPFSMSFPAIFGHMALFSTYVTRSISSSSSIHIHCIWVSP